MISRRRRSRRCGAVWRMPPKRTWRGSSEVIRASMAMTFEKRHAAVGTRGRRPGGDPLSAAAAIGDALASWPFATISASGGSTWHACRSRAADRAARVRSRGSHSGTAGTALFLAHLARRTGSARYAGLARDALIVFLERLAVARERVAGGIDAVWGYSGPASLAYAFAECGGLLRETVWTDQGGDRSAVARRRHAARDDEPGLWAARRASCSRFCGRIARSAARAARLARAGAQAILAAQLPETTAADGVRRSRTARSLGAAHGAGGIAYALAALDRAAPDEAVPRRRRPTAWNSSARAIRPNRATGRTCRAAPPCRMS